MGYTHYWNNEKFTKKQWLEVIERGKKILSCATVIPLQFDYDDPKPVELSKDCIRFNGVEEDGHETFLVDPFKTDFEFCKTALKPYDTVVVAFLIMLNDVNPEFEWSSDGDDEDHEQGRKLYEESRQ